MESARPSRFPISSIWWLAFVAEALAAILETIEGHYFKSGGLYCMALAFLLLAAGGAAEQPRWRTLTVYLLALLSIGLLVYQLLAGERT